MIGAEFSYNSGKTRSYLLHKGIPFTEKAATAWTYLVEMPRRVGAPVVPVVHTPQGEWLQDTSVIMDILEARFPENPARPVAPGTSALSRRWRRVGSPPRRSFGHRPFHQLATRGQVAAAHRPPLVKPVNSCFQNCFAAAWS